jgi:hypothetical protein
MFCDPISLHTQESNLASQYLQKFCLESRKTHRNLLPPEQIHLDPRPRKVESEVGFYIKDSRPPLDISEPGSSDLGFLSVLVDNPIMEILLKFNLMN